MKGVDSVLTTKSLPAPLPTTGEHGSQESRS